MKGALKVIIPIIMIVAGIAMCSVAYAMGERSPSIIIGDRDYSQSFGVTEEFQSIVCELDILDVNFVCGDVADGYTAVVDVVDVDEDLFDCKVSNGVLRISHVKENKVFPNINLGFGINTSSEITVIVPSDSDLYTTSVELGVGEIRFADYDVCDTIVIDQGVGETELNNISAIKGDFDIGIGDFKAKNVTFNNFKLDGGIGDVKLIGELTGDVNIDRGIGDIKMELFGDYSNHEIDVDGDLGSEKIKGIDFNTSGDYEFNVDNGIGDIKLYGAGLGEFDISVGDVNLDNQKVLVDLGIIRVETNSDDVKVDVGGIKVETNNDDVKVDVGDIKVDTGIEKIELG